MVALTAGLFAFALIAGVGRTAYFAPIAAQIDVWAIALLTVCFLSFSVVGALVAARTPRNAIAWLFLSIGGSVSLTLASLVYLETGLPWQRWAAWVSEWTSLGPFAQLPLVLLLFPDGKLPSRRWRPIGWACVVNAIVLVGSAWITPYDYHRYANPLAIQGLPGPLHGGGFGWWLLPLVMMAGAAAFVMRFRHSSGEYRQQLKWFALAASVVAAGYVVQQASWVVRSLSETNLPAIASIILIFCVMTIPLASGIAILRYRLYDIDIIVNRALVYSALTAVSALLYLVGVVGIGSVIQDVTGRENDSVVVAATTLGVAAAFRPARVRIQSFIDRRFYRRRYDAAAALASFSARLRDEVDLDAISVHLVESVQATMQPERTFLWLRHRTDTPSSLPS